MLRQLSSSHANGQSMVIYPSSMKHGASLIPEGLITMLYPLSRDGDN